MKLLNNYARLPVQMQKASGSWIWDSGSKKYLDLFVGFGAGGLLGHCHPLVTEAICKQAQTLCSHGNLFSNSPQEELAELLVEHSIPGKVFFCHSGAEADECAIKLVRKRSEGKRYKIISFENSFHGRTLGGLSITPKSFQQGFGPMLPGNIMLPFNDVQVLLSQDFSEVGGIFLEPIQGEGGVNEISPEFAETVNKVCKENDLVLVCDEVWSAPARTGTWFAYQQTTLKPDVITCAKALGGGLPMGCTIISDKYADVLGPGTHGCTMGGNPLCAAAAVSALKVVQSEGLVERARELEKIASEFFDVQGKGVMLGISAGDKTNSDIFKQVMDKNVLIATAKNNMLRLAPALNIPEADYREGLEKIAGCL